MHSKGLKLKKTTILVVFLGCKDSPMQWKIDAQSLWKPNPALLVNDSMMEFPVLTTRTQEVD